MQRKATALRRPSGTQCCKTKNGKALKLAFGSNSNAFFIHFLPRIIGDSEAETSLAQRQ
jgi:hypothetical protein